MRKIGCVIGPPRSGTTSVAKALDLLGYSVLHWCPITSKRSWRNLVFQNPETMLDYSGEWIVSSATMGQSEDFYRSYKNIVLLMRNHEKCLNSMLNIGVDRATAEGYLGLFDQTAQTAYFAQIDQGPQIIEFDIDVHGWERLCAPLGRTVPTRPFPHANAGPVNFEI